jgi:hypothetical protein
MIAGFAIFLFIISIAFSQRHAAEKRANIMATNQIVTLLKDKQQTPKVYSEITFPNTDISFRCEDDEDNGGYFTFKIADSDPVPLANEIIFAPQKMSTDKMIVWTEGFTLGFPVSVFTYITTPDSILLINDDFSSTYAIQLYDALPNITKKIDEYTVDYIGYEHVKVVCFGDDSDNDCPDNEDEIDYIMITPGIYGLFDYGDVTFHKNGGTDRIEPYITAAGLYGAISSDSATYYSCQMSRVMKQLDMKRLLTEYRLLLIQSVLEEGDCRKTINITLENEITYMRNLPFDYDTIRILSKTSRNLDIRNSNLINFNCPTIY